MKIPSLRPLLTSAATILLLMAVSANANSQEVVLDGTTIPPAAKHGSWDLEGGTVAASFVSEKQSGYWLPEKEVRNGVIKARIEVGKKLQLGILFRATHEGSGGVRGYQVSIRGDDVQLERLDKDDVVVLSSYESIRKLKRTEFIDVIIILQGDRILAQVHGGRDPISLMARDNTYKSGRIGLRRHPRVKPRGKLTRLEVQSTCGTVSDEVGTQKRYITLAEEALKKAPEALAQAVEMERVNGNVVLESDTRGLLAAYCSGTALERVNIYTPLKYVDEHFLVAEREGLEETEAGVVLDNHYKDPSMVHEILKIYRRRYPDQTRLVKLGESREGRPIYAIVISNDIELAGAKRSVMLNGAHHGNEPFSVEVVLHAIQYLLENQDDEQVQEWLDGLAIWAIPVVNPDGLHGHVHESLRIGRKNGLRSVDDDVYDHRDGVDLNRNYPFKWGELGDEGSSPDPDNRKYRGESAASEPETRAMMALSEREHFAASLTYHTGTVALLAPYAIDGTRNPEPNVAWTIGRDISLRMRLHPSGRSYELTEQLYSVDGIEKDWYRHAFGTIALLLEASRLSPLEIEERRETLDIASDSWKMLFDHLLNWPSISGRVVDKDGNPVVASVSLDEIKTFEGEDWTTRCRDGRFDQFVPESGTWTLRVEVDGSDPVVREVEVGSSRSFEIVVVPAASEPQECDEDPLWREKMNFGYLLGSLDGSAQGISASSAGFPTPDAEEPAEPGVHASEAKPAKSAPSKSSNGEAESEASSSCSCQTVRGPAEPSATGIVVALALLLGGLLRS